MAVPKTVLSLVGSWTGSSKLNFSEDPTVENVTESMSTLRVFTDRQETFATVTYTWEFEGVGQEGTLLLVGNSAGTSVTGGWADSWHQNGSVMSLVGSESPTEGVGLTGSYGPSDQPKWGWRIDLALDGDGLELSMTNITPDGAETWAVLARYSRVRS